MLETGASIATLPLEVRCECCRGQGVRSNGYKELACGECDGSGYIPTELGERILSLMRHNFKSMLDRKRDD